MRIKIENFKCLAYHCGYSTDNTGDKSKEELRIQVSKAGGNTKTNTCPKCGSTELMLVTRLTRPISSTVN